MGFIQDFRCEARAEKSKAEMARCDFMKVNPAQGEAVRAMVRREIILAAMHGFREGLKFRDEQAVNAKGVRK